MSLLKTIKAQLGLSNTATNNFTITAEADNGTMKLARGNAGATTQDIMTVDAAGLVTFPQGRQLTLGTSVATTSGTTKEITGIPSWAKRITLLIGDVSTTGTSPLMVQVGVGTYVVTGYESVASQATSATTYITASAGFILEPSAGALASYRRHGRLTIDLTTPNYYLSSGVIGNYSYGVASMSAGRVSTTAAIDRIRITTSGGTDTFNGGVINVMYEG